MKRRTWLNIASTALVVPRDRAQAQTAQTQAEAAPPFCRSSTGPDVRTPQAYCEIWIEGNG